MSETVTQSRTEDLQSATHLTFAATGAGSVSAAELLPKKLDEAFKALPKLSLEQCGHIRHFHNLSSQLDGDWAFFGAQEVGQEWDTAYRYQLATMCYAAGAAHYHHLPAMRSTFKTLMKKIISKMLRVDVWGYWFLTSQSGIKMDPDLKELRKPWADPVCKENIMYSGHLLLMVSLYSMLFNDDSFDQKDSIVFNWDPLFWGMGPESFSYTRSSLQNSILKEMERENWMGVCCEPNMIFVVCNQFPLIATRYNDIRNGTKIIDDVLPKYKAAWAEKGMVSENGLFRRFYLTKQDRVVVSDQIGHTAWAMAFMPWNATQVKSMYPTTGLGFLQRIGDRTNLNPPQVAKAIKEIVEKDGCDPDDEAVLAQARESTKNVPAQTMKYMSPAFGHVAQWLSEIAGPAGIDPLLKHADMYLNPSWSKGGLYYARHDAGWDEEGNYICVEPYTGNSALGYARLNVKDGQKKMWEDAWTAKDVEQRPWIDGVQLSQNIDVLRGRWDGEKQAMIATFRTWNGDQVKVVPVAKNLPYGTYGVYLNGDLQHTANVAQGSVDIAVELTLAADEVDLVLLRSQTKYTRL